MNPYKARKARWSLLRKELHDSLSLCNWMGPWIAAPLKERGYRGDDGMESKLYSLCTGDRKSSVELDHVAERIFTLHRALTIRGMATRDMRAQHDKVPEWAFQDPEDRPAFTKGTNRLQEADMEKARDMLYKEMGWDVSSGAPTAGTYKKLGLEEVAKDLAKEDLLPQRSREDG
jgi:aldehyde:ferredoxin oxidoreductase